MLAEAPVPAHKQSFHVWFTGLRGPGRSTIAEILAVPLVGHGRQVTVHGGDVVRAHLAKGLQFPKGDRDANSLGIGFAPS